jgi:hypothetical protein
MSSLPEILQKDERPLGCVADPDPGSGAFLSPGSGMGRKSASGSRIRDEQPGTYFLELRTHFFGFFGVKILKFFDADPETVQIRDPGWKKVGSGINHWDKHPGSATLPLGRIRTGRLHFRSNTVRQEAHRRFSRRMRDP